MLTAQEQEKRFELYNQGLTDHQIGKLVFVTPSAIYHWRKKNNLKVNRISKAKEERRLRKEKAELLEKERINLYNQGLKDVEIAHLLNRNASTISRWRKKMGLKRNK